MSRPLGLGLTVGVGAATGLATTAPGAVAGAGAMTPTSMTPIGGRRGDDVQRLQKKLQRSFEEKNMLLAEIQMLKQQVSARPQDGPMTLLPGDGVVAPPDGDKEHWNRLLEAQIRAGTMACVWCMKTQLVKMLAGAFHRWYFSTHAGPGAGAGDGDGAGGGRGGGAYGGGGRVPLSVDTRHAVQPQSAAPSSPLQHRREHICTSLPRSPTRPLARRSACLPALLFIACC